MCHKAFAGVTPCCDERHWCLVTPAQLPASQRSYTTEQGLKEKVML